MKTLYYSLAVLTLVSSLAACKNEEDDIFEDSAANRLEQAKAEFTDLLASDGGKWVMEYFSNEEEPGYVMVCTFGKGGEVKISGNHKWLAQANTFQSEVSLWEMIDDNGPVLTFNSYNNVFHVFSDPENITGPFAPTNPDRDDADINETGYGHNGDYEFMILGEAAPDTRELKLLGKKRGFYTWLRRLPADTDDEAYLANIKSVADNMFSDKFTTLTLTDGTTGEKFVLTKTGDGVFEAYPKDGDAVMQTVSANAIITDKGIRFMSPFEIPRADTEAEDFVVESLVLQADGSLKAEDGSTVTGPYSSATGLLTDRNFVWMIDVDRLGGTIKDAYTSLSSNYRNKTRRKLLAVQFGYGAAQMDSFTMSLIEDGDTETPAFACAMTLNGDNLTMGIDKSKASENGVLRLSQTDRLGTFIDVLNGITFKVSMNNQLNPGELTLVDVANPANVIYLLLAN